jgi:sulfatase maturation enzyme AslB (radical SAM superfamily)
MEFKIIPNNEQIGEYSVFIRNSNRIPFNELRNGLDKNKKFTQFFIESKSEFQIVTNKLKINLVSSSEFKRRLDNIKIPKWMNISDNLDKILDGNYDEIRPVTAEFVPTLNCNCRCSQCSYEPPKKERGVWEKNDTKNEMLHMTKDVMISSLDKLAEVGVENILFTGGGEPLMNPLTVFGMEYAKKKGSTVALYTNGSLLTKKNTERILTLNPVFTRISVYGGDQETVEAYTHSGNDKMFQTVIDNISMMAEQKKKLNSEMNLGLSYLVHPITAPTIGKFLNAVRNIKDLDQIDYIRFTPAVDYYDGEQHDQDFMENVFKNIKENLMPEFNDIPTKIKLFYHRLNDLNKTKSYSKCRASGWFAEVGPAGKLYLCCEKHFNPEYEIGDLKTQSFNEIWHSDTRNDLIKKINDSNCSVCPTLCKPHELNKIINSIELFRKQGKINVVKKWAEDLLAYGRECDIYCPSKLDNFQS